MLDNNVDGEGDVGKMLEMWREENINGDGWWQRLMLRLAKC